MNYSYTKEDLDISRWRLSDGQSSYYIPDGTVIRSNDYLIIAKYTAGDPDYFFTMFPNEKQGNEHKVLYQRRFLLDNYNDMITLSMNSYKGADLGGYHRISSIEWMCRIRNSDSSLPCTVSRAKGSALHNNKVHTGFNYYNTRSFQKNNNNQLTMGKETLLSSSNLNRSTPFRLSFAPQLLDDEEIPHLNDILIGSYDGHTWDSNVSDLVNNQCDNNVTTVPELTVIDNAEETICFLYDNAGNQTASSFCSSSDGKFSENPLEEIATKIYVTPNPTSSTVTLSWEADVRELIAHIIIVPVNGAFEIPVNFSNTSNSSTINLSSYNSGLYIARFMLTSGEVITKTIIKI